MLSFMNQLRSFTRTSNADLNPLILEGGRASLLFHRSTTSPYFMTGTIPPRLASELPDPAKSSLYPHQKSSTIIPPPHWHSAQNETFHVKSGRMVAMVAGKQHVVEEGSDVFVPMGDYHTFGNASVEQDLVINVKLDPDNRRRDERFFRNGYGYLDDCTKANLSISPFQMLVFLWSADIIPALPGPKFLMAPLSKILTWFGAVVIGKGLLGYKDMYPEYTPKELL